MHKCAYVYLPYTTPLVCSEQKFPFEIVLQCAYSLVAPKVNITPTHKMLK